LTHQFLPIDKPKPTAEFTRINGAMLNGLGSKLFGVSADGLPITCPSGNCTFPNFLSLAVCSEFADLADLAIQACAEDENGNRIEYMYIDSSYRSNICPCHQPDDNNIAVW
jgi:hypothetical protein